MFRLLAKICFFAFPHCFQIDFRKSGQQKPHEMRFFANGIQNTFWGGLNCDTNWISTDATQSGCSGWISNCLLISSPERKKWSATEKKQSMNIHSEIICLLCILTAWLLGEEDDGYIYLIYLCVCTLHHQCTKWLMQCYHSNPCKSVGVVGT